MPDQRKHRGAHPRDEKLFSSNEIPKLVEAVKDMNWLLSRAYPEQASLKLVGDKYRLQARQRMAIRRATAADSALKNRAEKQSNWNELKGKSIAIDGFNLLITIESALSMGFIFEGLDGCYRDLASIHGTYKKVIETEAAFLLVGKELQALGVASVHWYFDKPVSNSGRLKTLVYELAEKEGYSWTAELHFNPDNALIQSDALIVSSDSMVLDHCKQWFNLAAYLIKKQLPNSKLIQLR